jgi:hypothetical protein
MKSEADPGMSGESRENDIPDSLTAFLLNHNIVPENP